MKNIDVSMYISKALLVGLVCLFCWSCSEKKMPELMKQSVNESSANEIEGVLRSFKNQQEDHRIFSPFQNPPEINSKGTQFNHRLDIRFAENKFYDYLRGENIILKHRSYNGGITGATWRVKPVGSMSIQLANNLEESKIREKVFCDKDNNDCYTQKYDSLLGKVVKKLQGAHDHEGDMNHVDPANFNKTNLHVHGLHVSPKGNSDNVFVKLSPGQEFINKISIPKDHASGTFWYHGHVHGSTAIQVSSGMAGAIIIEGGLDEQPEIKQMKEHVLMLQQMPYSIENDQAVIKYIGNKTFGNRTWKPGKWRTTINGQVLPVLTMQQNEVQRWRFIHGGIRESINMKLISVKQSDEIYLHKLHVVAEDGIAYGYRSDVDSMQLHPGYRADLLIKAPETIDGDTLLLIDDVSAGLGAIPRQSMDINRKNTLGITNDDETLKVLAIVIVNQDKKQVTTKLPSSEDLKQYAPYKSLVNTKPISKIESMTFNIDVSGDKAKFQIDGESYNPDTPPRTLSLGKIQDWELSSKLGSHPFHIHVNHFQVIARQKGEYKSKDSEKYWVPNGEIIQEKNPVWKDTYMIKGDEKTFIRTVYKDFTGKFVLHCHILQHEDEGMMQRVEIIDSDQNTALLNPISWQSISMCR